MREIQTGASGSYEITVGEEHTADSMGNVGMKVLSTPHVVLMMEAAAYQAALPALEAGEGVVGTRIDVRHVGPTPVGRVAIAECHVEEVNGRRLVFACTVKSNDKLKAEARYESMIVDLQRLFDRAKDE